MTTIAPLSLSELNNRVARKLASTPEIQNVWVVAETSDVRTSGGHCYLELIEKDSSSGTPRARLRATIWSANYRRINEQFRAATGSSLASDIKIMAQLSVSFHPLYGLSANITEINSEYTLGDLLRRRREMIARLEAEGILKQNRELTWPAVPLRVAVISAIGAAGYGDFINQLYNNHHRLRFTSQLFPATMQGENTVPSVLNALGRIAAQTENFDCVVLIRGGGATGDLIAFENYELAANIAMFPLPVIVGIGHERDVTLLDYVANMRVKTPTAAAEWLIARGGTALERLRALGAEILDASVQRINLAGRRLELIKGQIPELVRNVIQRNKLMLDSRVEAQIGHDASALLKRRVERLDGYAALLDTLSPEATLRRGFSITRVNGTAITNPDQVPEGASVVTTLAAGTLTTIKTSQ